MICLACILLGPSSLFAQQNTYQGQILDEQGVPLIFASIQIKDSPRGVFSDLDGFFSIKARPGETLLLSYVGYETKQLELGDDQQLTIKLESSGFVLEEVLVRPRENPAWRIIRRAIANKNQHNPARLPGYTYAAYHKTVLGVDSLKNPTPQARKAKPLTAARIRRDSVRKRTQAMYQRRQDLFLNEMHLWVTETRSEYAFRKPNQHKETILATQSSLPNDFTGGINPISFQPFGFYQEVIRMEVTDQNYVNPLSKGTFDHYAFQMADTIIHATDTTYIIHFQPFKNKPFTALKGLLYINTDGYAVENVIAEPADTTQTLQFIIQQQSTRIDSRWFPQQLNADIFFEVGMADAYVRYGFRNRSILTDIQLAAPPARFFNHYRKENEAESSNMPDSLRLLPLHTREANTYSHWDSLPELRTAYRLLKSYNGLVRVMASGLWTGRYVDLVVPDLWRTNPWEGQRLGLGLKTSPRLFKNFSLYAYGAYGTKDQSWKYGGAAEVQLYRQRDIRLRVSYSDDLNAPGEVEYLSAINNPWAGWSARSLILNRLDRQEQWRTDIIYRPRGAWQLNAFWATANRQLTYNYRYGENSSNSSPTYDVARTGLQVRWAPKEQLIKMDQLEAVLYPTFPIIDLSVEQLRWAPDQAWVQRLSARIRHEQRWKYLGTTEVVVSGGWLSQSVPYPFSFQAPGNSGNGISGNAVFNTAGVTEFGQDAFSYLFFSHRFNPLLGRSRTPYSRPELSLIQQVGWGKLRSPELHQEIELKDMRHTFLESGLGLDNLLRIPYFKTIYIGLGARVWYRWGAYHLPELKENVRYQFTLNFSV